MSRFANGWGLFVSHDASLTGAPIVLLNFLRWLSAQQLMPFEVLLREGGPLQTEFERIAPTQVLNSGFAATLHRHGIPTGVGRARLARLAARHPRVVYS